MCAYQRSIPIISAQEEKIMRAPLINCEKWMPPEDLESYYKFIKLVFGIEIVQISEVETVGLHETCMKQLKLRLHYDDREERKRKKEGKVATARLRNRNRNVVNKNYMNTAVNPGVRQPN